MKRRLVPDLSREAWKVLTADALSALGNGLILPFLIIYLRDARGFPVEQAALVLSVVAGIGLVVAPATGHLIDRFAARRILIAALLLAGLSSLAAIGVDEMWKAVVWAILFGGGISAMWPAAHSLMATIVEPHQRAAVYSVHFALLNAGIGIGAILGGLLVRAHDPGSYRIIFLLDAATFLLYAGVLLTVRKRRSDEAAPASEHALEPAGGGWSRVVRDRAFIRILSLSLALIVVGYAQLDSSFPAFATGQGGISTSALGIVFSINTMVIVGLQLIVLRSLSGHRRTSAMVAVGVLWAACWLLTALAGSLGDGLTVVVMFMIASGIFAFGETFMQAALPALVNDLAPDDIRGRYNAVYSMTWSLGRMVGPAIGGLFLGAARGVLLFVVLGVLCAVCAGYARWLRASLPPGIDRFATEPEPVA